jgi:Glycosyl hydrolase family 26
VQRQPWKIRITAVLVGAAALFASTLGTGEASAQPVKLGAYTPYVPASSSLLNEYSAMVGRKPDVIAFYKDFFVPLMTEEQAANLKAGGGVPMITWEPDQPTSGFPAAELPDIASGRYDSTIRQAAKAAKEFGGEIMIRFAHEMNITAMPWGPGLEGNVGSTYVEAWRHVVTIFRQEGATNVKWVWCPNVDWGGVPFTQYFPGDEWVDYVGLDGYNWGKVGTENWQSLATLFGSSYTTITQLSSKPVVVGEVSSGETGGSKASWIREGFLHTIPEKFPRIAAVVWFNAVAEQDWRIDTSSSALEAFREVAASSLYGGPNPAPAPAPETAPVKKGGGKSSGKGGTRAVVKALRVTPSSKPTKRVARSRAKVVFAVSHRVPVELTLRSLKGRASYRLIVNPRANRGRISLARVARGKPLRPGRYRLSAAPLGGGGRHRHAGFRVVSSR